MSTPTIFFHVEVGDGPDHLAPTEQADCLRDLVAAAWAPYGATVRVWLSLDGAPGDDPDECGHGMCDKVTSDEWVVYVCRDCGYAQAVPILSDAERFIAGGERP